MDFDIMSDPLLTADRSSVLAIALSGFGDTIMAIPFFRALRQQFPVARITALTMWPTSGQVLSSLNLMDRVISHNFFVEPARKSLQLTWQLRRERFDLGVLIFPSNRIHYNLLTWLIRPGCGWAMRAGREIPWCMGVSC